MTAASFPLAIFLLLPGFISIYSGFLVSRFRRLPAFHAATLSLSISLALFVIVYPLYSLVAQSDHPGLLKVLNDPATVPIAVWGLLYLAALASGILFGVLDRKRVFEALFLKVGIDLRTHGDLWGPLLRESDFIRVHLGDGTVLYGWPEYYSADRSQPGPELYLAVPQIWDQNESEWISLAGVDGILLAADNINRIEFLTPPVADDPA